jgi:hypothetical protein
MKKKKSKIKTPYLQKPRYGKLEATTFLDALDDKTFHLANAKLMKKLTGDGIIKSLREIKKIDRIEMGNNFEDMVRVMASMMSDTDFSFYMHIPFINEGVIKLYTINDNSRYIHFNVKEVNMVERIMKIDMDVYQYSDGYFHKKYDFSCTIHQENPNDEQCDIKYENIKYSFDYLRDNYGSLSNMNFSDAERRAYERKLSEHNLKMLDIKHGVIEGDTEIINCVSFFIGCFLIINNYMETLRKENKDEKSKKQSSKTPKNEITLPKVNNETQPKTKSKNEVIIGGIRIKKGENSKIKIRKGVVINRQTDVWGVVGHVRRYKNGKVVYIKPYKKGPGRLTKDPVTKVYKMKPDIIKEVKTEGK